jgi:hypothetical protein
MMAILGDFSGQAPERKLQPTSDASASMATPGPAAIPVSSATAPKPATPNGSSGLRIAATLLRTAFIFILMALVIRVSQPQSETIWSAYETPGDLVRLWLGIGVCVWLGWQLFTGGPKDVHGYRTWLYLGLTVVPFSLICLVALW